MQSIIFYPEDAIQFQALARFAQGQHIHFEIITAAPTQQHRVDSLQESSFSEKWAGKIDATLFNEDKTSYLSQKHQ